MSLTSIEDRLLLPPQNEEAERACLGSCLIDPEAFDKVSEILAGPEDFYQRAYQEIYAAMAYLAENTGVIDLITVSNYLRDHGKLEHCGGVARLNDLVETVHSSAHVTAYAKIVADNAIARRLLRAGETISRLAVDQEIEVPQRVDQAEEVVFGVDNAHFRGELEPISDSISRTFDEAYERFLAGGSVSGLSSGFTELDELTNGLHPANLIVVGARPSMGKTAFALSIAVNVALADKPGKVAIFSLEMPREDLCMRMMCSIAKVNGQSLRSGKLKQQDWTSMAEAVNKLSKAPIFIDDSGSVTILDMKAKLRRLKKRSGLDLVIIDYLQLIRGSGANRVSSERIFEISEISRQLKGLSKELNVPIIALSQLSRNVESRQDKRPLLSDLRESGAIEQDADLVAFLYRDEYYNKQSTELNIAEVIVAKHRNGPIGTLKLKFMKQFGGFYNINSLNSADLRAVNAGGQSVSFGPGGSFTMSLPNKTTNSAAASAELAEDSLNLDDIPI
ncbi:MAG: replicative DNA helicase [Candidatus Bruticola sp.]